MVVYKREMRMVHIWDHIVVVQRSDERWIGDASVRWVKSWVKSVVPWIVLQQFHANIHPLESFGSGIISSKGHVNIHPRSVKKASSTAVESTRWRRHDQKLRVIRCIFQVKSSNKDSLLKPAKARSKASGPADEGKIERFGSYAVYSKSLVRTKKFCWSRRMDDWKLRVG